MPEGYGKNGPADRPVRASLDIETLSTHKRAVVLSVGACLINGDHPFHVRLCRWTQVNMGRHISAATAEWWMRQTPTAFKEAMTGEMLPEQAMRHLDTWLRDHHVNEVWVKGPSFDGAIIEDLCDQMGMVCPIHYRKWRDVRTIQKLMNPPIVLAMQGEAHNALDDAIFQASVVEECLARLAI